MEGWRRDGRVEEVEGWRENKGGGEKRVEEIEE